MVFRTKRGEVGSPPRGPCLLQGSRRRPAHNPRRHLLRPRLYDPRLDVLGERGREPDAVCGWILWGEEIDVERFAMQTAASGIGQQASACRLTGRTLRQFLERSNYQGGTHRLLAQPCLQTNPDS